VNLGFATGGVNENGDGIRHDSEENAGKTV
jgi:hypothetical protein